MKYIPKNVIDALIISGPGSQIARPLHWSGGAIITDGWTLAPCEDGIVEVSDGIDWVEYFASLDDALIFVRNTGIVQPVARRHRSVWGQRAHMAAVMLAGLIMAALLALPVA